MAEVAEVSEMAEMAEMAKKPPIAHLLVMLGGLSVIYTLLTICRCYVDGNHKAIGTVRNKRFVASLVSLDFIRHHDKSVMAWCTPVLVI